MRAISCDAPTLPNTSPTLCIFFDVAYKSSTSLACALIASCCFLLYNQIPATTAPIASGRPINGFISIGSNNNTPCKPKTNGIIFVAISPILPPANDAATVSPLIAPIPRLTLLPKALICSLDNLLCFVFCLFASVLTSICLLWCSTCLICFSVAAFNFSCKAICFLACFKLIPSVAAKRCAGVKSIDGASALLGTTTLPTRRGFGVWTTCLPGGTIVVSLSLILPLEGFVFTGDVFAFILLTFPVFLSCKDSFFVTRAKEPVWIAWIVFQSAFLPLKRRAYILW